MGIKSGYPDIGLLGNKIAPEEIDRYEVYHIVNPSYSDAWVGTWAVAGTSAVGTAVLTNAILDYPRSLEFRLTGTAAGMTGTTTAIGFNQFGGSINEVFTFAGASNGGTVKGTKIFASITEAPILTFGTAVGNGTARLGVGTSGTTALFGLPAKLGGTTDVKFITKGGSVGALTVNGGTIAAFVDVPNHAIKAPTDVASANNIMVWYRPTYDAKADPNMSNLSQRV